MTIAGCSTCAAVTTRVIARYTAAGTKGRAKR